MCPGPKQNSHYYQKGIKKPEPMGGGKGSRRRSRKAGSRPCKTECSSFRVLGSVGSTTHDSGGVRARVPLACRVSARAGLAGERRGELVGLLQSGVWCRPDRVATSSCTHKPKHPRTQHSPTRARPHATSSQPHATLAFHLRTHAPTHPSAHTHTPNLPHRPPSAVARRRGRSSPALRRPRPHLSSGTSPPGAHRTACAAGSGFGVQGSEFC